MYKVTISKIVRIVVLESEYCRLKSKIQYFCLAQSYRLSTMVLSRKSGFLPGYDQILDRKSLEPVAHFLSLIKSWLKTWFWTG